MSDREQWRFQWPDGTWIRWNAQTQSWEKEDQGQSATPIAATPAPRHDVPRPSPPGPEGATKPPGGGRQPVAAEVPAAEPTPTPSLEENEPARTEAEPVAQDAPAPASEPPPRTPRPSGRDVLPPQREPERPGGSLWPTIVAGAVVGVGVGLLLSALIR